MIRRSRVVTLVAVVVGAASISTCVVRRAWRPSGAAAGGAATGPCRATLGLEVTGIPGGVRRQLGMPAELTGAYVTELLPGGPAERAGVQRGDVVLQVDGKGVAGGCDFSDLSYGLVCRRDAHLAVWRAGKTTALTVMPVEEQSFLGAACASGSASACFRVAWLRASGAGVREDRARAMTEYEGACEAGSAGACAARGIALTEEGQASGMAALERACTLGSGPACAHLGYLHSTGTLVERNDSVGIRHYEKACEAGDANGCYNVGLMNREARGVGADLGRAVAAYDTACRGGSSPACTDLGYFYENGEGVPRDAERALGLYRLACDGTACSPSNLLGCVNLGRMYRDGTAGHADPSRAAEIFRDACARDLVPGDVDPAPHQARACSLLGSLFLTGRGVPRNDAEGLRFSTLGCDLGDGYGCYNAGVALENGLGVEADVARARELFSRACNQGDAEACEAARQASPR